MTSTPLPSSRDSIGAKLALAEFLLTCEDMASCAQHAMEWLGKYVGVRKALCLAVDPNQKRLFGLAGYGLPASGIEQFSLSLEDLPHPLLTALSETGPVVVRSDSGHHSGSPFGEKTFLAIPLGDVDQSHQRTAVGLILVSPVSCQDNLDLLWLIDLFRPVLRRRMSARAFSEVERGLNRERALLYNILNTVHDPIILTDPEGRLVISNRSAESLFGSREEVSEGRRRAMVVRYTAEAEFYEAEIAVIEETSGDAHEAEALSRAVVEQFRSQAESAL